jgi:hypothetical protein
MVSARLWRETALLGLVETGRVPREDFVCQSCGACFTLRALNNRVLIAALIGGPMVCCSFMGVLGGLIAWAAEGNPGGVVLGLVLLPLALAATAWILWPWWNIRRHPVVPDAPVPAIRYRLTEPMRRCSCGVPAQCTKVVKDRFGLELTYACPACEREFTVDNVLGAILTTLVSSGVLALGAFLLTTAPGEGFGAWLISGGIAFLGVGGLTVAAVRFTNRLLHPVERTAS